VGNKPIDILDVDMVKPSSLLDRFNKTSDRYPEAQVCFENA
jgi:hypothetical protein